MAERFTGVGSKIALMFLGATLLSGCASWFDPNRWNGNDPDAARHAADPYGVDPQWSNPEEFSDYRNRPDGGTPTSLLDTIFSPSKSGASDGGGGPGIGVNSFLWHASLDTVSFMPLASADPFGGTIITDWYSPPDSPNERFKMNIFILGRDLRADGVRARVFRQNKDPSGNWVDAPVDQATGTDIENAILTRARQIRMSTVAK
jgi:Domain of unknown function (DUF3576)